MTAYNILTVGISPQWRKDATTADPSMESTIDRTTIRASLEKYEQDRKQFKNTAFEGAMLLPDDDANWDTFVAQVQSRRWDGITLGGGVRTIPGLGDFFTRLVHLVLREQPHTVLMFPLLPENIVSAVKKYIPDAD